MVEQYASTMPEWSDIPWSWLIALVWAFLTGLVVQDFYNKKSWVWNNWRAINKIAEIAFLRVDENSEPCAHISVIAGLIFIRQVNDGRISVTVKYINAPSLPPFIILDERNVQAIPLTEKKISLCHVRAMRPGEQPHHSLWGDHLGDVDLKDGEKAIVPNGEALVVIQLKNGFRRQTIPLLLHFRNEKNIRESLIYTKILKESDWEL